jgi:hypothetical protein
MFAAAACCDVVGQVTGGRGSILCRLGMAGSYPVPNRRATAQCVDGVGGFARQEVASGLGDVPKRARLDRSICQLRAAVRSIFSFTAWLTSRSADLDVRSHSGE